MKVFVIIPILFCIGEISKGSNPPERYVNVVRFDKTVDIGYSKVSYM